MTRTLVISVAALVGALTLLGGGGEPPLLAGRWSRNTASPLATVERVLSFRP